MAKNRNKRVSLRGAQNQLFDNSSYLEAPQTKKSFHIRDLKKVVPLTNNQELFFQSWLAGNKDEYYNDVVCGLGAAGAGKTLLACYLGLQSVLDENSPYEKLVIVRSVVPSRDIGFLPGTAEEKSEVYKLPYKQVFDKLFPWSNSFKNAELFGLVQFEITSYLRGSTFENCVIVFDELQNATEVELETVLTRLGKNARMICIGDFLQNDLGSKSGLVKVLPILRKTEGTAFVEFGIEDIVRSGWVKNYLTAKHRGSNNGG